jgi:predicted dehydrogenase
MKSENNKNKNNYNRREFIKKSALAGMGIGIIGPINITRGANSPNERVVVALMGGRGRAGALAHAFAEADGAYVKSIFDVDHRPLPKLAEDIKNYQNRKPEYGTDFRRALDDPDIDALVIAAPDHWHTPAAIMAMQAGKHVYVEKPASYNPAEAELIVRAQQRYDKLVQIGTQQRSSIESINAIQDIGSGEIGRPYYAKTFYAANRGSIGNGKIASVPDWLDYELWQGPAPRTPYRDNIIHYNWHWFLKWGTGELLNNGTHEYDVARWALGVDLPVRISSSGGRYHFDDDWEFYDTQNVTFEFPDNKAIHWEGRSCNGFHPDNRGRGTTIYGTEGTIFMDRSGYKLYNLDNELIKSDLMDEEIDQMNPVGGDAMTDMHVHNFVMAIREGVKLNASINQGQKSVLPLHLGNISQYVGRSLNIDPVSGRIIGDSEAMSLWSRRYEPGWEPVI